MKLKTTPWGRLGLTDDLTAELRGFLPDEYTLSLSGTSRRGPFRAGLGTSLLPPSLTGGANLVTVWSDKSPLDAAILAIRTAAGDVDNLAERLRASLVALGLEPAA